MRRSRIHVLMGGTGIGKTRRSVRLACSLGAPVIVVDRFQVFEDLAIGTGRPSAEELAGTTRIYLDSRLVGDGELSAEGAYERLAAIVGRQGARHGALILEGGSTSLWTLVMERRLLGDHDVAVEYLRFEEDPAYLVRMSERVREMVASRAGAPSVLDEIARFWGDHGRRAFVERIVGYDAIATCCRYYRCAPHDLRSPRFVPRVVDAMVLSHATYAERQRKVFDRLSRAHLAPAMA